MENVVLPLMHDLVALLLYPVAVGLIVLVGMAVFEIGTALGERYGALKHVTVLEKSQVEAQGRKRIERADMIARIAPMFGLMGTLIPLGPGLAALGQGNLTILTEAITIAFDTTVLGLLGWGDWLCTRAFSPSLVRYGDGQARSPGSAGAWKGTAHEPAELAAESFYRASG